MTWHLRKARYSIKSSVSTSRAAFTSCLARAWRSSQAKMMLYPSTSRYSGLACWSRMSYFSLRLVRAGFFWLSKAAGRFTGP